MVQLAQILSSSVEHLRATFRFWGVLCLLLPPGVQASSEVPAEVRELYTLIEELRGEVHGLRAEVEALKAERDTVKRHASPVVSVAAPAAQVTAPSPPSLPSTKPAITSRFAVDLYGYVKADVFRDSATTSHQEVPYWTLDETCNDGGEVDFTARQTRLGLTIHGPSTPFGGSLEGKLEFDFYGHVPSPGDVGGNHAYALRSRHLYVQWKNEDWSVLAGKTWEAYHLALPETLNFGTYFFQGMLGHRRMQLQATRSLHWADRRVEWTLALDEPVAGVSGADLDGDGVDDATDCEIPGIVGRLKYIFPLFGRSASLGVSGFFAEEKEFAETYPAFVGIVGGELPLGARFTLKGTLWAGQNLDGARGGIGQGINLVRERAIRANGGWVQLRFQATPDWWFNAGYSIDNPRDRDLELGQRAANETLLLNTYYRIAEPLTVGLEYFQVATDYLGEKTATNHRIQSSVTFAY